MHLSNPPRIEFTIRRIIPPILLAIDEIVFLISTNSFNIGSI